MLSLPHDDRGFQVKPSRRDVHILSLYMPLYAYAAILVPGHDSHFLHAAGLGTCPAQVIFSSDKLSVRI
jgi:hypothetical protein